MRLKLGAIFAFVCVVSLVLAACGGGGGGGDEHTYIITPTSPLAAGLYVTVVSPVALPQKLLDSKDVTVVEHAAGPEVCSYSKKVEGVKGKYASFNGKTVTVKVNGSNPFIGAVCSALKKGGFNPTNIAGH